MYALSVGMCHKMLHPVPEIQLFEWGQGPSTFRVGRMLSFDVFAGRPDMNEVLKCAKRIGISDFKTIYIQQMLMENYKNIPYG